MAQEHSLKRVLKVLKPSSGVLKVLKLGKFAFRGTGSSGRSHPIPNANHEKPHAIGAIGGEAKIE